MSFRVGVGSANLEQTMEICFALWDSYFAAGSLIRTSERKSLLRPSSLLVHLRPNVTQRDILKYVRKCPLYLNVNFINFSQHMRSDFYFQLYFLYLLTDPYKFCTFHSPRNFYFYRILNTKLFFFIKKQEMMHKLDKIAVQFIVTLIMFMLKSVVNILCFEKIKRP